MRIPFSAKLTLWLGRILGVALLLLTFRMHALLAWYLDLRPMGEHGAKAFMTAFYICVPVALFALWNLDRLLRNILSQLVFDRTNVRCISRVRWCCVAVSMICAPAAFFYQPLAFVVLLMAFLALVVSVLTSVMDAAVTIREENDLTI